MSPLNPIVEPDIFVGSEAFPILFSVVEKLKFERLFVLPCIVSNPKYIPVFASSLWRILSAAVIVFAIIFPLELIIDAVIFCAEISPATSKPVAFDVSPFK